MYTASKMNAHRGRGVFRALTGLALAAVTHTTVTQTAVAQTVHASAPARVLTGTALVAGQTMPVTLELARPGKDGAVRGSFVNGDERSPSSSGELHGTHLVLRFPEYARQLEGELTPAGFTGAFSGARIPSLPVTLRDSVPAKPRTVPTQAAPPAVLGDWEIAVKSPKGESAWSLHVLPAAHGGLKAFIQRVDGDTGFLYAAGPAGYDAASATYRLSRFSSAVPELFELRPLSDGTLHVTDLLHETQPWTARRPAEARRAALPPPTDPTQQTTMADPRQPLRFSAPTLAGERIANDDPRFKGKVVLVTIGGSWCPNCHDETPFLVDLYHAYHAQGLEIVDLSFEEGDELKDPERLRTFIAKYRIPYPVLLAGVPDDLNKVLPQANHLNCWPTTFFIGRDGLVKHIHAGFSGPSTGAAYTELKAETTAEVERLLAERPTARVP